MMNITRLPSHDEHNNGLYSGIFFISSPSLYLVSELIIELGPSLKEAYILVDSSKNFSRGAASPTKLVSTGKCFMRDAELRPATATGQTVAHRSG